MNVLVTGGSGYIGSIIVRLLLERGHKVRVMDIFQYGFDPLKEIIPNKNLEIFPGNIKNSIDVTKSMEDMDAIIHLAAIVGDPACAVQADNAIETNYLSTLRVAMAARDSKKQKFIFASTCSVYGAIDGLIDEKSELKPQSLYAETKILAERGIMDLANKEFLPVILRLGTLYGNSYRPRFDLVINYLTGKVTTENKAMIFGGDQWRPFIHVWDAANSFVFALTRYDEFKGEIFNVGATNENYQMKDIGKIFEKIFPTSQIQYIEKIKDPRSYKVSFNKIEGKGFTLTKNIEPTIREISDLIKNGSLDLRSPNYYNYHR